MVLNRNETRQLTTVSEAQGHWSGFLMWHIMGTSPLSFSMVSTYPNTSFSKRFCENFWCCERTFQDSKTLNVPKTLLICFSPSCLFLHFLLSPKPGAAKQSFLISEVKTTGRPAHGGNMMWYLLLELHKEEEPVPFICTGLVRAGVVVIFTVLLKQGRAVASIRDGIICHLNFSLIYFRKEVLIFRNKSSAVTNMLKLHYTNAAYTLLIQWLCQKKAEDSTTVLLFSQSQ